ncbi:HIRAN domain-containing protein [Yersinia aldovae]|uniref:HIRAN domain-containing protein n=1 Tax=Yersinia aldovae TaxID=29483 RepID=UPI0011AB1017|nr:HIRAN domain-containing protein [Yersinia aldovae]
MEYFIDVAGIAHKNRDGTLRSEIVSDRLSDDLSGIEVSLRRCGGNRHDKNAVGIYISKSGRSGFDDEMIGFVDRDQAKEISPMLKNGGNILKQKITRVWFPEYSSVARPCVNIRIKTDWTKSDVNRTLKVISEQRKDEIVDEQKTSDSPLVSNVISFVIKLFKRK